MSPASFSTTSHSSVKVRVGPRRDGFANAKFTAVDVPPFEFWAAQARPPLVDDLSPEECAATARKYAALALEDSSNWRETLTTKHGISLYTLHHMANMIIMGPPSPAWHLGTHILYTCVQLSYRPSILTMVRLALRSNKLGDRQFSGAEEAFARLLARRDDPDACTLQGLIYARQNSRAADDKASEWFRRAMRIGGNEPGAWEWQSSCVMGLATIYRKQKQGKQARELLRYAAVCLDIPEACWLYASILDKYDPKRPSWLKKAAASGIEAAARELAQIELAGLDDWGLSRKERMEREALADEWLGIAGDKALF
ncbi:hypothetical protein DL766_007284 [Monosporascus sp. MC13-8B]|uniref:Uncharacterized protein n=1 Tax=Monosporascus cannonballus TaxID=155416 RepID=A0ABY0GU41_9PEZI|nr:hypothetical protein DL762_009344 [Monosporascus cannonballus]RYO83236.1 hypothetical protein DL763_007969 [Monosporascus cannonballus]RYP24423.1 hypothetical protein DL766_007284 [Monosporascus sp. MC13-8B]